MSKITLLILTIFFAFGCNHNKQVKPNIVLIMTDDLNDYNEDLMGHPQVISPNIKKLADSGISFINAYSNDPMCGPSRSSMITGVYPHNSSNFWLFCLSCFFLETIHSLYLPTHQIHLIFLQKLHRLVLLKKIA